MTWSAAAPVSPVAPDLDGPAIMSQQWRDLASVHWAVDPALVAPHLPPATRPDVHDGATYVGLLPFRMVDAGGATGPPVPWAGTFLETNVRLYSVDHTGRRGIVFCSLDADRLVVVLGARTVFGLPYRWARSSHRRLDDGKSPVHEYVTRTRWPRSPATSSRLVIRDLGRLPTPGPDGQLAHFLSARWGLHVAHLGHTWFVPNHHEPWPLHRAELVSLDDGLVEAAGFPGVVARAPDQVLFSPGVHTTFGRPWRVPAAT